MQTYLAMRYEVGEREVDSAQGLSRTEDPITLAWGNEVGALPHTNSQENQLDQFSSLAKAQCEASPTPPSCHARVTSSDTRQPSHHCFSHFPNTGPLVPERNPPLPLFFSVSTPLLIYLSSNTGGGAEFPSDGFAGPS